MRYTPLRMSVTTTRIRSGDVALLRALNEVYAVAFDDEASYRGKLPSDVLAAYRRRGVARTLIRELQLIGHERDAWVVFVQADPGDEPAIALYTPLGTREDVHHFDLPVEPPAPMLRASH